MEETIKNLLDICRSLSDRIDVVNERIDLVNNRIESLEYDLKYEMEELKNKES